MELTVSTGLDIGLFHPMKRIAIIGGTGFIGEYLGKHFSDNGQEVTLFGRNLFANHTAQEVSRSVSGYDVLINLAGANIAKRWTSKYKRDIYESRIETTSKLVEAINLLATKEKPKLIISASAVGYYSNGSIEVNEEGESGDDFLAQVCKDWEEALTKIEGNIRVVRTRFGVVLASHQGAFPQMILPFRFGLATVLGSGKQRLSWVHIFDLAYAYDAIIQNKNLCGAVNVTAPDAPTNKAVALLLAKRFTTLLMIRLPEWVLQVGMGNGHVVLTDDKSAFPKKLIDSDFTFTYPTFSSALDNLLDR